MAAVIATKGEEKGYKINREQFLCVGGETET
jgi:hypothetical protein